MPISVSCKCGQKFQAKDELGGKSVRCPRCRQPIQIPAPAPVGGMADLFDEIGLAPLVEGPRCPHCSASLKPGARICVSCGTNLETGERYGTQLGGDEVQLAGGESFGNIELDRAARNMADEKVLQESLGTGAPWWVLLLAFVGICAFITGMLLIPKSMVMFVTGGILLAAGVLAATVTGIWILVLAFQENTTQGLLCLFVPLYFFYYAIIHWEDISGLFIIYLAGAGLQVAGYILILIASWLASRPPSEFGQLRFDHRPPILDYATAGRAGMEVA